MGYDARGLEFPVFEANIFLPDVVTPRQLIFGIPILSVVAALPIIYWLPAVGFALAAGRGMAGWGNNRQRKRMERELRLFGQKVAKLSPGARSFQRITRRH